MKIEGIDCREAIHLGFRHGDPTKDFDRDGRPVKSNYVVIVRLKDCELYEEDGKSFYNPDNAPSIPINHGATFYGYGKRRMNNRYAWIYDRNTNMYYLVSKYETTPFYAVKKGRVYQGTIKHLIRHENGTIMHVQNTEEA